MIYIFNIIVYIVFLSWRITMCQVSLKRSQEAEEGTSVLDHDVQTNF